jgi:hypothetical protein
MGVGTPYESEFKAKVLRLREFVRGLDAEYVLYMDGRDSLLLAGEEEILAEFSKFQADFVISMERGSWPVQDGNWRAAFPRVANGRQFPNAGGWMGTKSGVLRVLDRCAELQNLVATGKTDCFRMR